MATYRKLHIQIDTNGGHLFGKHQTTLADISITPPVQKSRSDEQSLREIVNDISPTGHPTDYFVSVLDKICHEYWLEAVSVINMGTSGGIRPWINFLVKDTDLR